MFLNWKTNTNNEDRRSRQHSDNFRRVVEIKRAELANKQAFLDGDVQRAFSLLKASIIEHFNKVRSAFVGHLAPVLNAPTSRTLRIMFGKIFDLARIVRSRRRLNDHFCQEVADRINSSIPKLNQRRKEKPESWKEVIRNKANK